MESKPSSSPLSALPAALQAKICGHLRGSPYETLRDMSAFRGTSRVQSEVLRQEGYPWPLAQELRPLIRAIGQCFREEEARLSSLHHVGDAQMLWERTEHARAFGPALGFLSPGQRGALVCLAGGLPDENRSIAIWSLGRELAHLEVSQRENLVNAALILKDCKFKANAITGLVSSLEHLDPLQRDNLVTTAIDLPIDYYRASVFQALGPKLTLLEETQCAELAQAAADLTKSSYAQAVAGLFKGLADMDPTRREMIINPAAEALDRACLSPWDSVDVLPVVEYFGESQRKKIIALAWTALDLGDEYFGIWIPKVAPAVEYIGKPYRDAAFHKALDVQGGKGVALHGLGMWIAHLDEAQREALLRAASSIPSDDERAHAIGGMAAGMVHLGEDGRNTLIAEVKRLTDADARSSAIRDFGESESLQYLSPGDRHYLIAAATSFDSIVGLAKSLRHLAQPERELLLDAARRLHDPRERAEATVALGKATSEALLFREPDMRDQ